MEGKGGGERERERERENIVRCETNLTLWHVFSFLRGER